MKDDELLHKWIDGSITEAEYQTLSSRPEFDDLKKIYDLTNELQPPQWAKEEVLSNILKEGKNPIQEQLKTSPKTINLKRFIPLAAIGAILIATWFVWPSPTFITIETQLAEIESGTFPDGSSYNLNASSVIKYNEEEWAKKREVVLEGEAYFKVQKGSQFIVSTPLGSVEVLGTQFSVRQRGSFFTVSCEEGRVAVIGNGEKEENILEAGDGIHYTNEKQGIRFKVQPERVSGWVDGNIYLKDVSLGEILNELERQFDIAIQKDGIALNEILTSNFSRNNLEEALMAVCTPVQLKYEIINPQKVRIYK